MTQDFTVGTSTFRDNSMVLLCIRHISDAVLSVLVDVIGYVLWSLLASPTRIGDVSIFLYISFWKRIVSVSSP